MVVQNERDNQVLALLEPRLQFHPEYETHVVMMLQRLDKVKKTKRVLAFSLNRIDRDVHGLALWSDRTLPEGGSQAFSACAFHCLNQWRVAVRTHFQKIGSSEANGSVPAIST